MVKVHIAYRYLRALAACCFLNENDVKEVVFRALSIVVCVCENQNY